MGTAGAVMGFAEAVKSGLRKTFDFKSRASRPEYWWFALFVMFFNIAAALLGMSGLFLDAEIVGRILGIAGNLLILAMLVPHLAVLVRRLHDVDQSGWLVAALVVLAAGRPFVQSIYLLGPVWLAIWSAPRLRNWPFWFPKAMKATTALGRRQRALASLWPRNSAFGQHPPQMLTRHRLLLGDFSGPLPFVAGIRRGLF